MFLAGCESLEDTYKEYAGNGEIRYLAQCTQVNVNPGWEKLNLSWTNSPDPLIDKIKVLWVLDDKRDSVLLDSEATTYTITGLTKDQTYEIAICAVDKDGNTSLPVTNYVRPYTSTHETVLSFPQLIAKHFFVKNRLAIIFSAWSDNVSSARLTYTKANGTAGSLELSSAFLAANPCFLMDEVLLADSKVYLERKGYLGESEDLVSLPVIEFAPGYMFSVDFKSVFMEKYGKTQIDDTFVNSVQELEIDYSLASFEDILYLPNLKKLILGKNRFLNETYLNATKSASKLLDDVERSKFALKVANQLNGLTVERYNNHFLPNVTLPYMTEMGNPVVPTITPVSTSGWTYSSVPENTSLSSLFDGYDFTDWKPIVQTAWRAHTVTVDMKMQRNIKGVRVTQKKFNPTSISSSDLEAAAYAPAILYIQSSTDGINWSVPTHVEGNTLGNTGGEITIINFKQATPATHLRFTLNDRLYGANYSVCLSDIVIFY